MIFLLAGLIIGHRCLGDVGVGKDLPDNDNRIVILLKSI